MSLSAAFMGIDDEFDTEFDEEIIIPEDDEKENLPVVAEKKAIQPVDSGVAVAGTDYVSTEIKGLIESSKDVLGRLDATIKIGGAARLFEVYSQLTNSITAQLKEFRQMHEAVAKIKLEEKKKNIDKIEHGDKVSFTSDQVLDLIIKANDNSEIKKIDAEFTIDDTGLLNDDEDDGDGDMTSVST